MDRWKLTEEKAADRIQDVAERIAYPLSWGMDGESVIEIKDTIRGDFNPLLLEEIFNVR